MFVGPFFFSWIRIHSGSTTLLRRDLFNFLSFFCYQVHLQTQQGGRKLGVISQTVHIGEYPLLYQMRMRTGDA